MKYFREIKSGLCDLPLRRFDSGSVSLTVAVLNGDTGSPRWQCEEMKLQRLDENNILVLPNDADLPSVVSELTIELSEMRCTFAELYDKYAELSERLNRIMEGYDLT